MAEIPEACQKRSGRSPHANQASKRTHAGRGIPHHPAFPRNVPGNRARAGCFSFPGQANRHVRHRHRTAEGGGGRSHHPAHRSRPRPNAGYMLPDLPGTTPDASWLSPLPGKRGSKQRHLPMQWEKGNLRPFRPGHPVRGVPSQAHCWHVPGPFPPPPFSPWCAAARPASPGARRRLGARVDQLPHDLARGGRKAQRRRDPGAKLNHVGHKTILSLAKVRKSAGVALTAGFGPPDVKRSARRAHCRGRSSAPPRRATFSEMNFATPLPALTLARSRGQASLARRFGAQAAPAANISTCGCRSRSPSVPSGRNPCARKACNARPRPGRRPPDGSSSRPSSSNSASVRCPRRAGGEFASTICRMTSPTAGGK